MKKTLWIAANILIITIATRTFSNLRNLPPGLEIIGGTEADQAKVREALPRGSAFIADALETLDKGWENMSEEERAYYQTVFDPGTTGEIDPDFVEASIENFKSIRNGLGKGLRVKFVESSSYCEMMTLFYTDFMTIYACPYLSQETNPDRIARDFVHEIAHMMLLSRDRAYFSETDSRYLALLPEAQMTSDIPLVNHILREIMNEDTLYNADSYSEFAANIELETSNQEMENESLKTNTLAPEQIEQASELDQKLLNAIAPASFE